MNKYIEISNFICGRLVLIDYDISFENIMIDFFKESDKEYILKFKEEIQKLLLDLESNSIIPLGEILEGSNFDFDLDGLKELCEDILIEYEKHNL